MAWILDADKPIYAQLVEIIQMQIVSGQYKAGDKFPSVRDLAAEASVNPNTMQRTSGRTVTEDKEMIQKIRTQLADEYIRNFFRMMQKLGYTAEEILILIKHATEEGNHYGSIG